MDLAEAKQRLCDEVDRRADLLLDISHEIHAHPELGFEEQFAHDVLTGAIDTEGIAVERSAFGLKTAFMGRAGLRGPVVAILCEYDALPGVGHACGHNVIAAAGLGAGLAAASLADELGGRLVIMGTPAEEGGGGKVKLIDLGAFAGVDAAMMVHPASADLRRMNVIAVQQVWVEYHGEAAHASASPWRGKNALDAAVLGYTNIAALRQHIRPDERIHGIFTHAGDQANVVPHFAAARWYVRAPDLRRLELLKARVLSCLKAGADASGCRMEIEWKQPVYADMVDSEPILDCYSSNAATLGRKLIEPAQTSAVVGSTDMGNVSHVVPSIHPMIAVAPPGIPIHSPGFTAFAGGPEGDSAVLAGAKALAMTVADLWMDATVLDAAREALQAARDTSR